jgi:hypothetical protein
MVDDVLAATGRTQARIRDLPSRVVVYLLLTAGLFGELGYRQLWARLVAGLVRAGGGDAGVLGAVPGPPPGRRNPVTGCDWSPAAPAP